MDNPRDDLDDLRACSFLDIACAPLDMRSKFRLARVRLVLILGYIFLNWFVKRKEEPSLAARSAHVRTVARIFELNCFPEILSEWQICPLCNQFALIMVHPDMVCDKCWLQSLRILEQFYRDLRAGMNLDEAQRLVEERLEELAA